MSFWPLRAFRPSWRGKETGKLLPGPLVLAESVTEASELLQVGTFGRLGPPDQLVAEALIVSTTLSPFDQQFLRPMKLRLHAFRPVWFGHDPRKPFVGHSVLASSPAEALEVMKMGMYSNFRPPDQLNSVTYDPRPQDGVVVGEWTAFDQRVLHHLRIQP